MNSINIINMKKLTYFFALLILTAAAEIKAQTAEGSPDANYSIYKNKLKKSDENLVDEKKNTNPKFWLSRAELMMDIFDLHREFLAQGTQQAHVKLFYREPMDIQPWEGDDEGKYEKYIYEKIEIIFKDGIVNSFEETVKLYENSLSEATRSLEKTQELDTENKLTKDLLENYNRLKKQYERQAIEEFFKEKYDASFYAFAAITTINEKPIMEGVVDTTLIYYAGMAASRAELPEKAIEYYEKAKSYDYPEPDLYIFLKKKYWEMGDTAKGIESLLEGFKRFPDNQSVLIELINYYLVGGKTQEALDYLQIAQEEDPTNLSFIFAEATLYDKMGETEKARETYQRCIDINTEYFNAYYNLGVMYYNKAVEMYKEVDDIRDPLEYGIAKDAADEVMARALPFMEKANEIDPEEFSTLETLKTLYYRMGMMDRYDEVKAKLATMDSDDEVKDKLESTDSDSE